MELGQGERCGCVHTNARLSSARLKCQYAGRPEKFESRKKRPCAQPEDQERFDQTEGGFTIDPDPGALAFDLLPFLLRRKIDDVVLHVDWLDFNSRTRRRYEKLHNSSRIRFQRGYGQP